MISILIIKIRCLECFSNYLIFDNTLTSNDMTYVGHARVHIYNKPIGEESIEGIKTNHTLRAKKSKYVSF
jgi:hypothetical protein